MEHEIFLSALIKEGKIVPEDKLYSCLMQKYFCITPAMLENVKTIHLDYDDANSVESIAGVVFLHIDHQIEIIWNMHTKKDKAFELNITHVQKGTIVGLHNISSRLNLYEESKEAFSLVAYFSRKRTFASPQDTYVLEDVTFHLGGISSNQNISAENTLIYIFNNNAEFNNNTPYMEHCSFELTNSRLRIENYNIANTKIIPFSTEESEDNEIITISQIETPFEKNRYTTLTFSNRPEDLIKGEHDKLYSYFDIEAATLHHCKMHIENIPVTIRAKKLLEAPNISSNTPVHILEGN